MDEITLNLINKYREYNPEFAKYTDQEIMQLGLPGFEQPMGIMRTDQANMFGGDIDDEYVPMPEEDSKEESGIAKLLQYLPFGDKSITINLLRNLLPQQDPRAINMRNFYGDQYGLTPTGSLASGIMAGYNPISGGLFGTPVNYGLADAARRRIEKIANRKAAQTDASRARIAELQRFAEADTISRARQAAPDVYRDAGREDRLGPGGGFSTTGSGIDSGFQSASSSPSGRGRQDY